MLSDDLDHVSTHVKDTAKCVDDISPHYRGKSRNRDTRARTDYYREPESNEVTEDEEDYESHGERSARHSRRFNQS